MTSMCIRMILLLAKQNKKWENNEIHKKCINLDGYGSGPYDWILVQDTYPPNSQHYFANHKTVIGKANHCYSSSKPQHVGGGGWDNWNVGSKW